MCTSILFKNGENFYAGRNLDLDTVYGNQVVITPRNYPFQWREAGADDAHYAMIGMAVPFEGYPLYFDGMNEKGLYIGGLNFPQNADYKESESGKLNLASFEIIPYLLAKCASVDEVKKVAENLNITNIAFNKVFAPSPLHWHVADQKGSIVIEQTKEGLFVYDDAENVLTNNPNFPWHESNMINYMHLSPLQIGCSFARNLNLKQNSVGTGTFGLPGGYDSVSRFVRAAFGLNNAQCPDTEQDNLAAFFRVLNSVAVQRGVAQEASGDWMVTQYSSCANGKTGMYYYMTYSNYQINAVSMMKEDLAGDKLIIYPVINAESVHYQN